jgi:hypothetical protein
MVVDASKPADGADQEVPLAKTVRENLLFLLGLSPILIAMMRVFLMAQGDYGTIMTLVRTLDVRTLITATFVRSVGIFTAAATGYILVRVFWLGTDGRNDDNDDTVGKARPGRRTRGLGSPAFLFVLLIFLISLLSIYPEQLFDKDINLGDGWKKMLWPVDLVRAFAWVLAIALVLRYLSIPSPQKPQFDVLRWLAPLRRRLSTWRLRPNLPEILTVAPVVLLLFWSNLTLNERMWLPIEVITLSQTPEKLRTPPRGTRRGWVVRARSRSTSPRTSTNTESRCIRSSERMGAASRSWGMCCRFRTTGPPS